MVPSCTRKLRSPEDAPSRATGLHFGAAIETESRNKHRSNETIPRCRRSRRDVVRHRRAWCARRNTALSTDQISRRDRRHKPDVEAKSRAYAFACLECSRWVTAPSDAAAVQRSSNSKPYIQTERGLALHAESLLPYSTVLRIEFILLVS